MVFLLFAIGDGTMDKRVVGEHQRWAVEQSTEGLNVPVEKVLGMFSPDEMVVKWCGGTLVALFGLAIIGGIVNWRRRFLSPFFVVLITTSSQPELFVRTQDAEFAVRVQNGINDAWASAP